MEGSEIPVASWNIKQNKTKQSLFRASRICVKEICPNHLITLNYCYSEDSEDQLKGQQLE